MVDTLQFILFTISAVIPFTVYLLKKHMDMEEMKRELPLILYHEIKYNEKLIIKNNEFGRKDIIVYFHTNVYDGIVASTNIRYFPDHVQEILHDLYHDIRWKNNDCKSKLTLANIELIEQYEIHSRLINTNFLDILQTLLYYRTYGTFCNIIKTIFVLRHEQMYVDYKIRG